MDAFKTPSLTKFIHKQPWYVRFHDLMRFRVREILLLSTAYDAFILEEDGSLTERLFAEYAGLNLSSAPRITHATSSQEALDLIKERRFDLVITMVRLEDSDVNVFGHSVKAIAPKLPVVLLMFNEADIDAIAGGVDKKAIDYSFLWRGDAVIVLTIIKLIEDKLNAEFDINEAGVKGILVVEDSVRRYSAFLPMIYPMVMLQSQSLIYEGLNDLHRLLRMRARPKVLLARDFEEAIEIFHHFEGKILALITDINFPREGKEEQDAGFDLIAEVEKSKSDVAILVQSAKAENAERVEAKGYHYINKNATNLQKATQAFLLEAIGFGEFIFRLPDRTEIAKARDMYGMLKVIKQVPAESLEYHASHHHFSTWFYARCYFDLADKMRPSTIHDFTDMEMLRQYLVENIQQALNEEQEGIISDFSAQRLDARNLFIRSGKGSIGGKGRSIAFMNSLFVRHGMQDVIDKLPIKIPKTFSIGTEEFELFMQDNCLHDVAFTDQEDQQILERFLNAKLSDQMKDHLSSILRSIDGPLAVRSSSILEDSQFQPFAGIYSTYMLPNNDPDPEVRLRELRSAVKAVYASTFSRNARSYILGTPHSQEEERMGVVIQEVVGQRYGDRYYPLISGVGQSYNYYAYDCQKAEDGIVQIGLGMGYYVVSGRSSIRFSPTTPQILPQFAMARDYLAHSQRGFFAIDLSKTTTDFYAKAEASLQYHDLTDAETDGTLNYFGSVYSFDDNTIRDNLRLKGPRVLTFNNILRWNEIPLPETLHKLLMVLRKSVGFPVEIEFAMDWPKGESPVLYLLQMRPLAVQSLQADVDFGNYERSQILCETDMALGHGTFSNIRDIVFVKQGPVSAVTTPKIAEQVGNLNSSLIKQDRGYFLIGPGRWGSSDPSLGIPVQWSQIAGARLIAETSMDSHHVEPSQGTHFFQNIVSKGIGYLTLSQPARETGISQSMLDRDWLEKQPVVFETEWIKHIHLDQPLIANLDGRVGRAVVLKSVKREA